MLKLHYLKKKYTIFKFFSSSKKMFNIKLQNVKITLFPKKYTIFKFFNPNVLLESSIDLL